MLHLDPSTMIPLAAVALAALAAAWLAVGATIRVARRIGWRDRRHDGREGGPGFRALPRVGGVGIIVAVAAAVLVAARVGSGMIAGDEVIALGILALAIGGIGVIDDVRSLHGTTKLMALIVAAALAWLAGLRLEVVPGTDWRLPLPLAAAATILWMTAIPTAVNLIDGLDGLASGLAVIACAAMAVAGVALGDGTTATLAVIVLAATVGFWIHNRHPARIFMGDGGAMFLGFVLAALALRLLDGAHTPAPAALTLAGLAWPIYELVSTVIRRLGGGLMRADAGHVHHRLHARLGHPAAVRTIHLFALAPLTAVSVLMGAARAPLAPTPVSASVATADSISDDGSPVSESHLP